MPHVDEEDTLDACKAIMAMLVRAGSSVNAKKVGSSVNTKKSGSSVYVTAYRSKEPLVRAICYGSHKLVSLLLEHGADVNYAIRTHCFEPYRSSDHYYNKKMRILRTIVTAYKTQPLVERCISHVCRHIHRYSGKKLGRLPTECLERLRDRFVKQKQCIPDTLESILSQKMTSNI